MVVKLNSYLLPDPIIDKMRSKIEETRDKMVEQGFGLCLLAKTNILAAGEDCSGGACEMERKLQCITGQSVGGYHTHPKTGSGPSIADLLAAYRKDVECIGSARDNDIKCYIRTGRKVPGVDEEIASASEHIEEPLSIGAKPEEFQRWESTRNSLLDKYFIKIDVNGKILK